MFISALVTKAKISEHAKCTRTDNWIKKFGIQTQKPIAKYKKRQACAICCDVYQVWNVSCWMKLVILKGKDIESSHSYVGYEKS